MHSAGSERGEVAGKSAGPGEIVHQIRESGGILTVPRIEFGQRPFEKQIGEDRRRAVSGSDNQKDIRGGVLNQTIEVRIDEIEAGLRAPVAEQAGLDILRLERLAQERVIPEIELRGADVVRGAKMSVDLAEAFLRWVHAESSYSF